MRFVSVNSDGFVRLVNVQTEYVDTAANFVLDGGPALSVPARIQFAWYSTEDGRVLANTVDGNQVEAQNFDKTVLELAIDAVSGAVLNQAIRRAVQPPPPVAPATQPLGDASNMDNLNRSLRAIVRMLVQYDNQLKAGTYVAKTAADVKADFLTAWNATTP